MEEGLGMLGRVPVEALRRLFAPAGAIVILWGLTDVMISEVVGIVYARAGGRHKESQVPRQMARKIDFLRRCFRQIEALQPYSQHALEIMTGLDNLKIYRECFAHGYPGHYDEATDLYTFYKYEPETPAMWPGRTHAPFEFLFTYTELREAMEQTHKLGTELGKLITSLRAARMPED